MTPQEKLNPEGMADKNPVRFKYHADECVCIEQDVSDKYCNCGKVISDLQSQLAVAVEALEHCADKMMSKKAKEALAKIKVEK